MYAPKSSYYAFWNLFFLPYYSQNYAHIFTHYNTVIIIIIYAYEPNFRNVNSVLAVFGVGGCSIEVKDCYIKVKDCSIRINHLSIKVRDCFIRVGDCSIRVYPSFHRCYACTVSVMHQNNFWISVQEKVVI